MSAGMSVWVTLGATAVTAVATGVLAWVTWVMADATKRMAAATRQPLVVATFEPSRWSFIHAELVIENTGNSPAFDVQLAFDPPLISHPDTEREKEMPLNRISVLRPGVQLRNWVGKGFDLLEARYRVTVSWIAAPNASRRESMAYDVDLAHYKGLHQLGSSDPSVKLAQEVTKLRESVEKLTRGSSRLEVNTFTAADRIQEDEALERRWRKVRESNNDVSDEEGESG